MRARSWTARRLPWHTWSTSSSISGSMPGGGGKIAPRASPRALAGASVRTLDGRAAGPEGWLAGASVAGEEGNCDEGDSAGRLPEPGRLGSSWPGLLGARSPLLGAASMERLGKGEMGLLLEAGLVGLAALGTGWMGLLGAAERSLEEALMGRLGTG